jgi:thiamine-monophosphate kinase
MNETIADIGEFGLIDRIHALILSEGIKVPGLTLGMGDDCAAFRPRVGYELLVTCDSMVEGRHYLPAHITPYDLGRRAMTLNISDIGAMGGSPLFALVSLGLKSDTPLSDMEAMYRGFLAELNPMGSSIIGGNITKSEGAAFLDITLIGEVEPGVMVRRSTAKVGDVILVTGYPGQAVCGLERLLRGGSEEDLREDPLVRAFLTPSHRAREGRAVARSGYATAMIDTSDGLLGDLGHICQESRVGALLIQERLPLSKELKRGALRLGRDPYDLLLGNSDDYELILTCPPLNAPQIRKAVGTVSPVPLTEVGRITEEAEGMVLLLPDGSPRKIRPSGWDHFRV